MGYSEKWKTLEEILIELRKKGQPAPENIMSDLKSAKTMIKLMDNHEGQSEIDPRVEQYLANVEAYVITEAQKLFTSEQIDSWLRRLEASSCDVCRDQPKEQTKEESRFIPGVPRDKRWVRVMPIPSLPQERLEQLAVESGLSFKEEKDGHLVVFGEAEKVKEFLKQMTAKVSKINNH